MSTTPHRVHLPPEEFIKEAVAIVEEAQRRGVVLRILGAVAIYIHSLHAPRAIEIYNRLGRFGDQGPLFTDLDLVAYSKQRSKVIELFEKVLGFKGDMMINALFGHKRLIYYHPKNLYHVDIFFDKLEFSHDVYFGDKPGKGRLELDYPTITLADLLLEKLQIHEINFKDLVDIVVLLHGHDLCKEVVHKECIDAKYIAKVLADDWGFWYDATQNLGKVKDLLEKLASSSKLGEEVKLAVAEKVDGLLKIIDEEPKTKNWIKRAKIGTSKPWYRQVEEVIR
jgi:hypothetical protein